MSATGPRADRATSMVPPARARTCVLPLTGRVLYPLSYGGDRVDSRWSPCTIIGRRASNRMTAGPVFGDGTACPRTPAPGPRCGRYRRSNASVASTSQRAAAVRRVMPHRGGSPGSRQGRAGRDEPPSSAMSAPPAPGWRPWRRAAPFQAMPPSPASAVPAALREGDLVVAQRQDGRSRPGRGPDGRRGHQDEPCRPERCEDMSHSAVSAYEVSESRAAPPPGICRGDHSLVQTVTFFIAASASVRDL